jgi:hypothetical protein
MITTAAARRQIAPVLITNQSGYTIQQPALVEAHNSVLDVQFDL